VTVLADDDGRGLAGFVHVILDEDAEWGSLVDNLHVADDRRRTGIGTALLARAGRGAVERRSSGQLSVGVRAEHCSAAVLPRLRRRAPGQGARPTARRRASRLNGSPFGLRIAWPDVSVLARLR
jgi:GNAT superfamily N-acetyltransferase